MNRKTSQKMENYAKLGNPPRRIGFKEKIVYYFGDFVNQSLWFFILLITFFMYGIDVLNGIHSIYTFSGELIKTDGEVVNCYDAGVSENDNRVYAVDFTFMHPKFGLLNGTSYVTDEYVKRGKKVDVEYVNENPQFSRIVGMRHHLSGLGIFIVLSLFFAPIAVLVILFKESYFEIGLLKEGIIGEAKLKSKTYIKKDKEGEKIYKYCFEYAKKDGSKFFNEFELSSCKELEDEKTELILYHPTRNKILFIDEIPTDFGINGNGEFYYKSNCTNYEVYLILPFLTVTAFILSFLVFAYNL